MNRILEFFSDNKLTCVRDIKTNTLTCSGSIYDQDKFYMSKNVDVSEDRLEEMKRRYKNSTFEVINK